MSSAGESGHRAHARLFQVLKLFIEHPLLGVTEIHEFLGLDKSVIHRILRSGVDSGFLRQDSASSKYCVGLKGWQFGQAYEPVEHVRNVAVPLMKEFSIEHGVTSYLAQLDGIKAVYLSLVDCPGPLKITHHPGQGISLEHSAVGIALLATLDEFHFNNYISKSDLSSKELSVLRNNIVKTHIRGYSISCPPRTQIVSLGAPLSFAAGDNDLAISVSLIAGDFDEFEIENLGVALKKLCSKVSLSLVDIGN